MRVPNQRPHNVRLPRICIEDGADLLHPLAVLLIVAPVLQRPIEALPLFLAGPVEHPNTAVLGPAIRGPGAGLRRRYESGSLGTVRHLRVPHGAEASEDAAVDPAPAGIVADVVLEFRQLRVGRAHEDVAARPAGKGDDRRVPFGRRSR